MIKAKMMILFIMFITVSGCSEFALLASGSSVAISQNSYVKAYNGFDVLTIMQTDKGIKRHIYDQTKQQLNKIKK